METPSQAVQRLEFLEGQPLAAIEIALAIGVQPAQLSNYVQLSGLDLCSERRGQGRKRDFCYVDGLALALLHKISRKTNALSYAAQTVNDLLYSDVDLGVLEGRGSFGSRREAKDAFCASVHNAPSMWSHRKHDEPEFLVESPEGSAFYVTGDPEQVQLALEVAEDGLLVFPLTLIFMKFDIAVASGRGFKPRLSSGRAAVYEGLIKGLQPPADEPGLASKQQSPRHKATKRRKRGK